MRSGLACTASRCPRSGSGSGAFTGSTNILSITDGLAEGRWRRHQVELGAAGLVDPGIGIEPLIAGDRETGLVEVGGAEDGERSFDDTHRQRRQRVGTPVAIRLPSS